jgi:general secretion pathway protein J
MRGRSARRDGGFTLIEMLVSLTLLALVLALLPGTLRLGRRAWDSAETIHAGSGLSAALALIEQRLAEAKPYLAQTAAGPSLPVFSGTGERIEFIAPFAGGPLGEGLYRIAISSEGAADEEERQQLVLRLYDPAGGAGQNARLERVIVEDLASGAFRYFGAPVQGSERSWRREWTGATQLPELVELSLVSRRTAVGALSPLRVALKLRPQPPLPRR